MQTRTHSKTDQQLRDDVLLQLEWEPEIVSKDISVEVKDSVVTLTGFVHTYLEKLAAEKAAKCVYGVQAVAGDIEVKLGTNRSDPEIARDIVRAIEMSASVPDNRIKICVREGYVTLEGTLDWNFQRESAEATVRSINGVRGLANHIELQPGFSTEEVKTKIEDALRRSAEVDAKRIVVSAEGNTVRLDGKVRSWTEKEEAKRAAWAAPGVLNVVDHIRIAP